MTVYEVDARKLIDATAEELKKVDTMKAPEWSQFVKTGVCKERPPMEEDWWYVRAAAMMRTLSIKGPMGTGRFRKKYSAKRNRGVRPSRVHLASGAVTRRILQALEKSEFIKVAPEASTKKGKIIAPKGQSILDKQSILLRKAEKAE